MSGSSNGVHLGIDKGADRETREHPCRKTTWCTEVLDHEGDCIEIPRKQYEPPDYGPTRKR